MSIPIPNCKATDPPTNRSETLSEVWKLGSLNRSKKFVQPTYSHPLRTVMNDTLCNEMYMFQKSGNIRNTSNIASAGARNRYGSAFANIS